MYYIVQCIVINHFQKNSLAQMEEFDHKFKWTKTSQEVFQNFVNKRKSFPEKCFHKRQTFPREKLPYFFLPNPLEGSIHPGWLPRFKDLLGKLQWHLGELMMIMTTLKMYFQQGDFWSFWENRPTADPEEGEDSLPIWSPWMDGWSGGQLGKNCGEKNLN